MTYTKKNVQSVRDERGVGVLKTGHTVEVEIKGQKDRGQKWLKENNKEITGHLDKKLERNGGRRT